MPFRLFVMILVLVLLSIGEVQAKSEWTYPSPNGRWIAKVKHIRKSSTAEQESVVEIKARKGPVRAYRDYTSEDGEHGLRIIRASWTPDSRFFIFTTLSSGGHQSWNYPTYFFSMSDEKFHVLSDYLAPVADASFSLRSPDKITLKIWTPLTPERNLDQSIMLPISFRMSELLKRENRFNNADQANR
jgi:hypothetical protein